MKPNKSIRVRRVSQTNRQAIGFTLIELLASMAILSILIMVLVSMVNSTSSIWRYTTAKTEQFREAREGFESMTKKLSQATLNTYWDYDDPAKPTKYVRKAELRFLSGRESIAEVSSGGGMFRPTDQVFFFAPLGFVEDPGYANKTNPYRGLDYLLNTWGYFIQYSDDNGLKPAFVKSPARKRFRLMETLMPSQRLNLYKQLQANPADGGRNWIFGGLSSNSPSNTAYGFTADYMHMLAENIVALIVLPKLSKADMQKWNAAGGNYTDASLAPSYSYNTFSAPGASSNTQSKDPHLNPRNQLPPIVQVVMVAIDEASATRMSDADNTELLQKLHTIFKDAKKLDFDLYGDPKDSVESLTEYLVRKHINYRVFTSDVGIRGAKWSTEQTN